MRANHLPYVTTYLHFKKFESSALAHLAFDYLDAVDLFLDRTIAPRLCDG
jgi:hypothetical protein